MQGIYMNLPFHSSTLNSTSSTHQLLKLVRKICHLKLFIMGCTCNCTIAISLLCFFFQFQVQVPSS